jgi:outer membrane receptor protein involved in Fe transport
MNNPTSILGYRVDDVWYNADGTELQNPDVLANGSATGKIQPWLVNPSDDIKSESFNADNSFTDYIPQVNISPRISFSFPISDEAMFFAHYDILSQRPSLWSSFLLPTDYLFVENNVGGLLNNPNLRPERTTDYELGFTQTLSSSSAITLSAFYRELRDMIQVVNVNYAYPVNYMTYGNIDFGTVKGFTVKYDMRRTNNVSINANYTLQFADGTGSGATSGINLISSGQPNLRTLIPLDYDQRHRITATVDYRYGRGAQYNGPEWGKRFFQDAGANLIFNAGSGLPFSKQSNTTQDIAIGVSERSTLKGSLNGARLPWQFRVDARINKNIELSFGPEGQKKSNLNVYLQVMNLLDARNVVAVYRATGNPDDTGYLNAATSQNAINGQVDPLSFRDLYTIKMQNPSMFALPRRLRLGITFDF